MLFPISDDDRHLMSPAWVTLSILVANILIYFYQLGSADFTAGWSTIPWEIIHGKDLVGTYPISPSEPEAMLELTRGPTPIYLTVLSSMFMHAGFLHLVGNMLYLWIFGDNLEHRFGPGRFLFFYFASGLAGTIAHIALAPESMIPMLGASGAISGILGAYLVLFPWNRVNAVFFFRIVSLPAILVIGLWAVTQVIGGWGSLASMGKSGGVAYSAHIGGFLAGCLVGLISRGRLKHEPSSILKSRNLSNPAAKRLW